MPLQDNPQRAAAIQLIALTLMADGELASRELDAIDQHHIAERLGVDGDTLIRAVIDRCRALLAKSEQQQVLRMADPDGVEKLLDSVTDPVLRKLVCRAMLVLSKADGSVALAEQTLLRHALTRWGLTLDSVAEGD